ncbi:NAD(P)-dependent oxidoreductase [Agrobacterium tumefaciens]|uniref:NAD-dependent epimerase/dehydratase family protein n=1 Tax=Agrobacterium tumefaciens TaxID=358 RepID=UPI0012B90A36|nr:NAD(P)-dependent oxidoreductase [Agrobacterium tumefaciens]MQB08037.1 NAD(P)-dependent oxidoreductase [Agrobacterium tumefaciens]
MTNAIATRNLPASIESEDALEDLLSSPPRWLCDKLQALDGDIIVLGVAGKVGPTLARMAKRAAPEKRVIGAARFSDAHIRGRLESWGVETVSCDLLNRHAVESLPDAANVVYMAGKKFGTDRDPSFAWAMNTYVPALVAEKYRKARIVAFSTLCVYPFAPYAEGGFSEDEEPGPTGDYATSCVGRERMFSFFSRKHGTPGRLARLNYAIDLRYGVLHDIANWVRNGEPILLGTGFASVIWQGDANAQILGTLAHTTVPTSPLNVGGPEQMSVILAAREFGRRFGKEPIFSGEIRSDGWYNNTLSAQRLFGYPSIPLAVMFDWVADWIERGMPSHGKPTHYEERQGSF